MPAIRGAASAAAHRKKEKGPEEHGGGLGVDPALNATGRHLPAIIKFNLDLFDDVTQKEIEEVFHVLDVDNSGHLELDEFAKLLQNALSPPCSDDQVDHVFKTIDKVNSHDGNVSLGEFQAAMSSGFMKETLAKARREEEKRNLLIADTPKHASIGRELWVDKIAWRVSRDDSFFTLPYSIIFTFVFIFVVTTHLQIFERQRLQAAMEDWVQGFGQTYPGPYHEDHVANKQQMLEWLSFSGLPSVFSACEANAQGEPECAMAPRSVLVGDAKLVQTMDDGTERSEWFLNSPEAQAHLAKQPLDFSGAVEKRLRALWNWVEDDAARLDLIFVNYAEDVQTFGVTSSSIISRLDGVIVADIVCKAIPINPYSAWALFIVDGIYVIMICYSAYLEGTQIFTRGCIGYFDHCGIEGAWNAVDLFGILMGFCNCAQWLMFILLVQHSDIQNVLQDELVDGKYVLLPNVVSLSTTATQELTDRLIEGADSIFLMQLAMGTNVLSIMMKLFKAFGANARLQLVTATMVSASKDLFHFLVVFAALFVGFSLMGHILFGEDIEEFRSFGLAVNTAFESLLGDFDWFSDIVISNKDLGSGLPFWLVVAWFYLFMVFIVLVMMNMLLAIVMDHYSTLMVEVKADLEAAPTLWKQSANMYKRFRAQRTGGFMPNDKILYNMVDAKPQHHPEQDITRESLQAAFSKMPEKQIEALMKWMQKEADKTLTIEEPEPENIKLLKELRVLGTNLTDLVKIVTHSTCETSRRLEVLESSLDEMIKQGCEEKETKSNQGLHDSNFKPADRNKAYEDFEKLVGQIRAEAVKEAEQQRREEEGRRVLPAKPQIRSERTMSRLSCCTTMTPSNPEQRVQA